MSSVEETIEQLEHACKFDVDRAKLNNLMQTAAAQLFEINQRRDELASQVNLIKEAMYYDNMSATQFSVFVSETLVVPSSVSMKEVEKGRLERDAEITKKTLERFAAEYAPHGLKGNYTSFDVSQHAEAQSIKYSEEILSKGRKL